jgi:hypothetical protein
MNLLFSKASRLTLKATKPPILWVMGDPFFGHKAAERKVDGTSPSSAEVRNKWNHYMSTPHIFILCTGTILPLCGLVIFFKYNPN